MSRRDIRDAYRCGEYHKRGLKACTSHHIRVDKLDELLKIYVRKIKDNSAAMLDRLNADLAREQEDVAETQRAAENLEATLLDLQEELKATKRQRIRDVMKHPDQEEALEETYDELESDLLRRMEGIRNQIAMTVDKRNTIIQVNRTAKTALEVFDDILAKPKLDRNDLQLIIQKIKVYEDHIEVLLKADIDSLLRAGEWPDQGVRPHKEVQASEEAVAAMAPASIPLEVPKSPYEIQITQESDRHREKIYTVKVISDGEPAEVPPADTLLLVHMRQNRLWPSPFLGSIPDNVSPLAHTTSSFRRCAWEHYLTTTWKTSACLTRSWAWAAAWTW